TELKLVASRYRPECVSFPHQRELEERSHDGSRVASSAHAVTWQRRSVASPCPALHGHPSRYFPTQQSPEFRRMNRSPCETAMEERRLSSSIAIGLVARRSPFSASRTWTSPRRLRR